MTPERFLRRRRNPVLPAINPSVPEFQLEEPEVLAQRRRPQLPTISDTSAEQGLEKVDPASIAVAPARRFKPVRVSEVEIDSSAKPTSLESRMAQRELNKEIAVSDDPRRKVLAGEGVVVAPPPPGKKPSRFKTFLKGLGQGLVAAAPHSADPYTLASAALTGGVTGAINPNFIHRREREADIRKLEGEIGKDLVLEKQQNEVARLASQAGLTEAQAQLAISKAKSEDRRVPIQVGNQTLEVHPDKAADIVLSRDKEARMERQERQRQRDSDRNFQLRQEEADLNREERAFKDEVRQAEATGEAEELATTSAKSAQFASIYRNNAETARSVLAQLEADRAAAYNNGDDVSDFDARIALEKRNVEKNEEAAKRMDDQALDLEGRAAGAKGRARGAGSVKRPSRQRQNKNLPVPGGSQSGLFGKY